MTETTQEQMVKQQEEENRKRMDVMDQLIAAGPGKVEEAMLREYLFQEDPLVIDILCPTRNRPDNVLKFATSIYDTAKDRANVGLFFYIDQDDKTTIDRLPDLQKWADEHKDMRCRLHIGFRMGLAHIYEWMRQRIPGDIMMYTGDDIRFVTSGWDEIVRNAFIESGDRIVLLWGSDPSRTEPFPDNGFVSRWGINCLKYLFPVFPPIKPGEGGGISYTDIWLQAVYNFIGRLQYRPDIQFEHHHWRRTGVSGTALTTSKDISERPKLDTPYVATNILSKTWVTEEFEQRQNEIPVHAQNLLAWMDWYAETCSKFTTGYENTNWWKHYLHRKEVDAHFAEQKANQERMEKAIKAGMARDHLGRVIVPQLRQASWEKSADAVQEAIGQQEVTATSSVVITENGPIEVERPKLSRNDPCSCGSGRKYKNCCMIAEAVA